MNKKNFNIIVAIDAKNGIGREGGLPWTLPSDMAHFKKMTTQTDSPFKSNVVIMGRKTWESIPEKFRPLADRMNIVLTRNLEYELPASVERAACLSDAFSYIDGHLDEVENIFIIGGQQIYSEAIQLPECKRLYVTQLFKSFACDAFFPDFSTTFKRVSSSDYLEENMITFHFAVYERIQID